MKILKPTLLTSAMVIGLAAAAGAHGPGDFDGNKTADFEATAAKNKLRMEAAGAEIGAAATGAAALSALSTESSATTSGGTTAGAATLTYAPCIDGKAADLYPCKNIDLLAHVDITDLGLSFVNDIWGWTDRRTRREYALIGGAEGTAIVDISLPWRPKVRAFVPSQSDDPGGRFWRDIKIYRNHAFIVSEQENHGMQVVDLRALRKIRGNGDPVTLEPVAVYNGFSSTHNIVINEDTAYAYAVGTNVCLGGLEMVDIINPRNPIDAGCFKDHGYVHDAQCVTYWGPDREHRGKEICFSSATANNSGPPFDNTLSIVDVSDKDDIKVISNTNYGDGFGYSHQGWLTPDQGFYIHDDELDEFFETVATTTTRLWDLSDLENPDLFATTTNGQTSIDHNLYTRGRYSYASNYTTGLRIFDIRKIYKGRYDEVAFFDVYPDNDNATFEGGTWSNYPYFRRRNVVAVSSIDRGLFILRPRLDRRHY